MSTEKIMNAFEKEVHNLCENVNNFNWEDQNNYAYWLAQTYYLVRHTTRFIGLAAGNSHLEDRERHYMWVNHLKEESHHDLVALKDLEKLGYKIDNIPLMMSADMISSLQYYFLERCEASSLMGYALCLEGLASIQGPKLLTRLEAIYDKKVVGFIRLHAEVDQHHFKDGLELLKGLPDQEQNDIIRNLQMSVVLYSKMLEEINQATAKLKKVA